MRIRIKPSNHISSRVFSLYNKKSREGNISMKKLQGDTFYMRQALELAKLGCGYVTPNPMVGAVIVKNKKIIGQGYHKKCGNFHAERYALTSCTESAAGATLYVTLEPCCHYGRTPPCTEAIIEHGISRVVVGSADPNPLVKGRGVKILKENGIEVVEGVLQSECDLLNEVFFHFIKTKSPYVVMKYAMTMDGKIATRTGESKWITGEEAREHVQKNRHKYRAIMVGIGTVLADDPLLTCRLPNSKSPIRIICDTSLRMPLSSKLVQTANEIPTIIATCNTDERAHENFLARGCEIIILPEKKGHVDIVRLMEILGARQIDSILLEGGGDLNWSCMENGIVNKVQTYIAPKLFGGVHARTPIGGAGVAHPSECCQLVNQKIQTIGDDILIESEVKKCLQES